MAICMLLGLRGEKTNDIVNILAFKKLWTSGIMLKCQKQSFRRAICLFCNPKEKKWDVYRVLSLFSEAGVNSRLLEHWTETLCGGERPS